MEDESDVEDEKEEEEQKANERNLKKPAKEVDEKKIVDSDYDDEEPNDLVLNDIEIDDSKDMSKEKDWRNIITQNINMSNDPAKNEPL